MSTSGTVVVLNGPSSAGKTTVAHAVRARIGPRAAAVSLDHFFGFLHPDAKNDWQTFSTLTDAMFATATALARGGLLVVVDTVFERPESVRAAERALSAYEHHFVAVTCELVELEIREARRGDRRIGLARDQHARVFQDATYACRVDTSRLPVDACVDAIVALLKHAQADPSE